MPTPSEIRVSIDVGCHSHSVAIGLPSGEVLDEFDLAHRPEGFDLFFARVESHQRRYGGEVSVAMQEKLAGSSGSGLARSHYNEIRARLIADLGREGRSPPLIDDDLSLRP